MQRLALAALAGVAAVGAWWLLSGSEPAAPQQARAGASAESQARRDLFAPRDAASGARGAQRDPGAAGPPAPEAAPAATSGPVARTGTSGTGPRSGGSSLTDERLRGGSGGSRSSGRVPGPEPEPREEELRVEEDLLDEDEDEDAETDPEEVAVREAEAAAVAEQMGLLDEATLERRIERAMRGDDMLSFEEARNQVLADALVGLYLLSQRFPDTPIEQLRSMPMPGDPMASLSPARRQELLALARDRFSTA